MNGDYQPDNQKKRPGIMSSVYLPIVLALVLILGITVGVRLSGRIFPHRQIFTMNITGSGKIDQVLEHIQRDWVDSVNIEQLEEEVIVDLLSKLDPHSQYIPAKDFAQVNEYLEGNFEGIGIQFRIEKDTAMVITPIAGGPSEKVGIKAGDRIVVVDGDTLVGPEITSEIIMKRLKGPKNTRVNVSVYRRGEPGLLEFTIKRDVIPTYSLDIAYMVEQNIGYIKLNKFSATTHEEFSAALEKLKKQGVKKLILDLRNNAGGYLQAAIDVADEFLGDRQLIVYTEGRNRPRKYAYATRKGNFENDKLVILIDEGSASASEIVAGAVQDNDRGTIIGRRSFGKGLVQEQINLPDGSAIRLTTARYYTPTGRSIQRPYKEGNEEYFKEFHKRFLDGEVFHADSIHFDDSLKYYTPGGKVVYGGGGIMPDIYVPLKSGEQYSYFNKLINKGVLYDFAFEYTDANRQKLGQYKDARSFIQRFTVTQDLFNDLIRFASDQGIEYDREGIEFNRRSIQIMLKAYIGRNLFDNEGFYPVFHQWDDIFQEAVKFLKSV